LTNTIANNCYQIIKRKIMMADSPDRSRLVGADVDEPLDDPLDDPVDHPLDEDVRTLKLAASGLTMVSESLSPSALQMDSTHNDIFKDGEEHSESPQTQKNTLPREGSANVNAKDLNAQNLIRPRKASILVQGSFGGTADFGFPEQTTYGADSRVR
jgi:hypothetical protein